MGLRAHIMRYAYATLRGIIPKDEAVAGMLRGVIGKYRTAQELAKMAGSEPKHSDLDKWTVEQRAEAEDYREQWEKQVEELTALDLDKRLRQERAEEGTTNANFEKEARAQQQLNREPTTAEQTRKAEEEKQKTETG